MSSFEKRSSSRPKIRAFETADGIINGMNMLMLTGQIGDPKVRALFIEKMGKSQGIEELRIFPCRTSQKQFGVGLPEEQPKDASTRRFLIQESLILSEEPHMRTR